MVQSEQKKSRAEGNSGLSTRQKNELLNRQTIRKLQESYTEVGTWRSKIPKVPLERTAINSLVNKYDQETPSNIFYAAHADRRAQLQLFTCCCHSHRSKLQQVLPSPFWSLKFHLSSQGFTVCYWPLTAGSKDLARLSHSAATYKHSNLFLMLLPS